MFTPARNTTSVTIACLLTLALTCRSIFGEGGTTTGVPSPTAGAPLFVAPTVILPPPPKKDPPPESEDRPKKSGGAAAAAAAGKIFAAIMCLKMMEDAKEAYQAGDKARGDLLTMLAMKECQQAMQDDQAKNDNNSGKKKGQQNEGPQMAQLQIPQQNQPAELAQPSTLQTPAALGNPQTGSGLTIPTSKSPETTSDSKTQTSGDVTAKNNETPGIADTFTTMEPIPNTSFVYNEKLPTTGGDSGNFGGGFGGGGYSFKSGGEETKKDGSDSNNSGPDKKNRGGAGEGAGGGSDGGGSGSGSGGNDSSFDSMMSQLLGAPPSDPSKLPASEFLNLAQFKRDPNKSGPNIFEYASYRYKLAADEGRLKKGKIKIAPPLSVTPQLAAIP